MAGSTIKISNISPKASEKTIADFFSFCGKILNLTMRRQGTSVEAIVEFESEAAAKTALLLTNALIEDRPITVAPYEPSSSNLAGSGAAGAAAGAAAAPPAVAAPQGDSEHAPPAGHVLDFDDDDLVDDENDPVHVSHMSQQDIPHKAFTVPDEERSSTSVIASLLASGYTLGVGALDAAREVDERNKISEHIMAGAQVVGTKLHEFDQQYGISTTASVVGMQIAQGASALGDTIQNAWRNIDTSYAVSERTNAAATQVTGSVRSATNAVSENPTVASTVQTLSSWGSALSNMIAPIAESATREVEQIKTATKQKIDAVDRARGVVVDDHHAGGLSSGDAAPADATTPGADAAPPSTTTASSPPAAAAAPAPAAEHVPTTTTSTTTTTAPTPSSPTSPAATTADAPPATQQ